MKKRLAALAAAAISAASVSPARSFGDEAKPEELFKFSIEDGEATITAYLGSEQDIVIPSEISGAKVAAIGEGFMQSDAKIRSAVLPDGVKTVGEKAFSACPNLVSVSFGKDVEEIGKRAFTACPGLESFSASEDNSSFSVKEGCLCDKAGKTLIVYAGGDEASVPKGVKTIGDAAFLGKTGLVSVDIPEGVASVGEYAFSGCASLKEIAFPETVKKMGKGCFMSCTYLENAELGNVDGVPEDAFNSCVSLGAIGVPEGAAYIGEEAFFGCKKAGGLYIPGSVETIGANALGSYYDLREGGVKSVGNFVIYGDAGSAAEKYASETGASFRRLVLGDADGDETIDGSDATVVLKEYSLGSDGTFTARQKKAGDVNSDGTVDGSDATLILKFYGLSDSQPTWEDILAELG